MSTYTKEGNKVIVILAPNENENDAQNFVEEIKKIVGNSGEIKLVNSTSLQSRNYDSASADVVLSGFVNSFVHKDELFKELLRVLKPNGVLVIREPHDKDKETDFSNQIVKVKLNGFLLKNNEPKLVTSVNGTSACEIAVEKPSYEIGSSVKLSFAKPNTKVWKLDDDEDEELIDEDNLLDENDILKPQTASLKGILQHNQYRNMRLGNKSSVYVNTNEY